MHAPIKEMGTFIAGAVKDARAEQNFAQVLEWEAAGDIQREIAQPQADVVNELDRAQDPKSDGGEAITPREAKRIRLKLGA
jgi:hypothetical protein